MHGHTDYKLLAVVTSSEIRNESAIAGFRRRSRSQKLRTISDGRVATTAGDPLAGSIGDGVLWGPAPR